MKRVATPSDVRVAFVGAGPGEADLITVRGAARLQDADVVLFDSLADPALRRLAPNARWIDVGKRGFTGVPHAPRGGGRENTGQDTINALLVKHAQSGARVVRLKGGDPSVFGRLEEELEALAAAGIDCEVVPGVTAALAAAAATQRPLTRRGAGRSVALTTAMTKTGELDRRPPRRHRIVLHGRQAARRALAPPRRRGLAGGRRRRSSSRAPAGPTSSRASTASRRSATRPCCIRAGRRSSPSASALRRCTPTATRPPRPSQSPWPKKRPRRP